MAERTLILVKPDGVQRGLVGVVVDRLERKGYRLTALKMLQMDAEMARRHYSEHVEKLFFGELAEFITSGPLVALVAEGPGAVAGVRKMVGETNPADSAPGTIRGDYALTVSMNIIHASDSPERAETEVSLFFTSAEIFDYSRDVERWIL